MTEPIIEPGHEFERIDVTGAAHIDRDCASQPFWRDVLSRFARNRGAVFGAVTILVIAVLAAFGPGMNEHAYNDVNILHQNLAPRIPVIERLGVFDGGERRVNRYRQKGLDDVYYWFGTDTFGRDQWTRTWMGTRISLYIAFVAVLIDMLIGMSYGLTSGYFGGTTDMIMQRVLEVVNGIPTLIIVTLLMLVMPPGLNSIILALLITGWVGMSRVARAQMLKLREQEFVLASRTLGAGHFAIIFRDVLPNIFGQLVTMSMFSIPNAIFSEAFLSFMGLGVHAPVASLGALINDGYKSFLMHPHICWCSRPW